MKVRYYWKSFTMHILPRLSCIVLNNSGMYILEDMNFFKSIAQYSHIYLLDYSNTCHKLEKMPWNWLLSMCLKKYLEGWNTINLSFHIFSNISNHAIFIYQKFIKIFYEIFFFTLSLQKTLILHNKIAGIKYCIILWHEIIILNVYHENYSGE